MTVGSVVTDYTYNSLNQLTAIDETDDGVDDITYGYDTFGNLTSKTAGTTTTEYLWDALDRLTSVEVNNATIASYLYNGDGLRTKKTVGSTVTNFTWDPTGLGTVIHVDDGTVDDDYLWGLGLIGRIDGAGDETYAHSDGLGSIRSISDDTGAEVGTTEYDAFGATRSSTGVSYAFGFTGEQVDGETGFVYLRARYMDPGTGRFISQDPIGLAGGDINLYGYVSNTPVNLVDPTGLCALLPKIRGPKPKSVCDGIRGKIVSLVVELASRANDLINDKHNLKHTRPTGPHSFEGHRQQFLGKQRSLQNLLRDWHDQNCPGPGLSIPSVSYRWAYTAQFNNPNWWVKSVVIDPGVVLDGVVLAGGAITVAALAAAFASGGGGFGLLSPI